MADPVTNPTVPPTKPAPSNALFAKPTDTTYAAYEASQGFPQPTKPADVTAITPNQNNGSISPTPAQSAANSNPSPAPAPSPASNYGISPASSAAAQAPFGTAPNGLPYGSQGSNNENPDKSVYGNGGSSTLNNNSTTTSTGNPNTDAIIAAQKDLANKAQTFSDTITGITNGSIPLNPGQQAQIDGLKQQFQQLIDQQTLLNTGANGTANIRGYQGGAAEYDPKFQVNNVNAVMTAGANKIANLQTQEASAVANLTASLQNNNVAAAKAAFDAYKEANAATQESLKTAVDATKAAINDAHIANVISSGITDPKQILAALQKQGFTDISSEDISKTIKNLSPDAATIFDIQKAAASNGATPETLLAIGKSNTPTDALQAAAGYLQTATGTLGDYLQYQKDTKAKGLTPMDYTSFKAQQDAAASKLKTSEAYNTAYASAAGKAAAEAKYGVTPDSTTTEPVANATGITQATGLPLVVFNYLTQGTGALTRMSADQRSAIMKQANDWLNKNGIDYATFQSQYKAYNDALAKNVSRANQTQVMAGEVAGSADSLMSAIGEQNLGALKNLKAAVIVDLLAGKEVNDPTAMKYATQIKFMANDLAGYMAAARGASSPELQDQRDAADIISNGLSKGSVQAFKDSVVANEDKVAGVVKGAVDSTRKQVWGLFGVGDKYNPKSADPKSDVDSYVKNNPNQAETIAKLYEQPGWTDQDVLDYIKLLPK